MRIDLNEITQRVLVPGVKIGRVMGPIPECRYIEVFAGPEDNQLYSVYETGDVFLGYCIDLNDPVQRQAIATLIDYLAMRTAPSPDAT